MGAKGFPKSGVARGPVQNENVGPSLGKQAEKTRERQVFRYPASPFLLHVSSARAWATVPVHFPYGAPGQRRTELGAPGDPAGLGPASGPGSRRRYRETRAVMVRKNVPAREGTALLRA